MLTSLSLLEDLQGGHGEAWREMNRLYRPLLVHQCRGRVPEAEIDDIVQETLTTTCVRIADFRHSGRVGAFRAWLRKICDTMILKDLARRRRGGIAPARGGSDFRAVLEGVADDGATGDSGEAALAVQHERAGERTLLLRAALELATERWEEHNRRAAWLSLAEGLPTKQIAAELGIGLPDVHTARSRALRRVRQILEKYGEGLGDGA